MFRIYRFCSWTKTNGNWSNCLRRTSVHKKPDLWITHTVIQTVFLSKKTERLSCTLAKGLSLNLHSALFV